MWPQLELQHRGWRMQSAPPGVCAQGRKGGWGPRYLHQPEAEQAIKTTMQCKPKNKTVPREGQCQLHGEVKESKDQSSRMKFRAWEATDDPNENILSAGRGAKARLPGAEV